MAEMTPFTYGDAVLVVDGEHKGRTGAIVGMNDPEMPSVFLIEFGNGTDAEVPVEFLEGLSGA
jgi:ribosomal protein L24